MAKGRNEYFEAFAQMTAMAREAAVYLQKTLKEFDPKTLPEKMSSLHSIEHRADEAKHAMMKKLAREFVTPIEREDIITIANEIDDVTDTIEDVLMRIYMYNITEIRLEALAFADVIVRCCEALEVAMDEFHNFHKSQTLHQCIVDVNTMEEEGDALYMRAMRALYTSDASVVDILVWSETFDRFEVCCDACEHVAGAMESVIMNNS